MSAIPHPALLIADANVLIDYWIGDRNLLRTISEHFAHILVPSAVLDEVEQLTRRVCVSLELEIVEPTLEQWTKASERLSGLSLEDHMCLIIAQARGATCLTNDRRLRSECESLAIPVLWGLEPLVFLVDAGLVSKRSAVRVVRRMSEENPLITQGVVDDFRRKIGEG